VTGTVANWPPMAAAGVGRAGGSSSMGLFGSDQLVTFKGNGDIALHVKSAAEAKVALKQLRLRKQELMVAKRELATTAHALRASYTDQVRRRAPMVRGGGGFGRFVRRAQTYQRAGARQELAKYLKPLEQQRLHVEARIAVVDRAIVKVESYALKQS
jgi:hypothetical protein